MRIGAVTFALIIVSVATAAHANDESAEARRVAEEGARALEAHHFQVALERFRRAEILAHTPAYCLGVARAEAGLNKVVAARSTYADLLREASSSTIGVDPNVVDAARRDLANVESRIALATISVSGPAAPYVVLDNTPLPDSAFGRRNLVDPGTHVVRATARGFRPLERSFTVHEGGEVVAVLEMAPDADGESTENDGAPVANLAPAHGSSAASLWPARNATSYEDGWDTEKPHVEHGVSSYRWGAYAAFGLGGAGLLLGIVEGLSASSKVSELQSNCAPFCSQSDVDTVRTMQLLAVAGFVGAGVGAAAGLTLLFVEPKPKPLTGAHVSPYVGLGSVGAVGRF
jgi:hypothetical protein